MKFIFVTAIAASFLFVATPPAHAGGDIGYSKGSMVSHSRCRFVEDADELINYTDLRALKDEVWTRYEHASGVSNSNRAVYSQSPLFIWAGQAKINCARSYGYLRKRWKWRKRPDYVTLQKCECFYERMLSYLGSH